jgi:hypothetical protein
MAPTPDLDSLIKRLQSLRVVHGNIPVAMSNGISPVYSQPQLTLGRIASGPLKPLMKAVSVRGQPVILISPIC